MPLRLITGPANAAKAGVVLAAVRSAEAQSPLLVVPTAADADVYRRELVTGGALLGVKVLVFSGLLGELTSRASEHRRPLGALSRERFVAAATSAVSLERIGTAAATGGFARSLADLADELAAGRITPPRFSAALRAWAGSDDARRTYSRELATLITQDAALRSAHGCATRTEIVTAALDALRMTPALWRDTPVFLYGFDDLTAQQRDVVESLSGPIGADVTLSLTFEPGREAFAARTGLHQDMLALGAEELPLDARPDYYSARSREVLHHVERYLYEPDAPVASSSCGVRCLIGGGERAEIELAAQEIAAAITAGAVADQIAVVHRDLPGRATLIEQVFAAAEIPIAMPREVAVGHTALGRGLAALLRLAVDPQATADDVLTYLRAPGVVDIYGLVDELEVTARKDGLRDAAAVLDRWEAQRWRLDEIARLRNAATDGFARLTEQIDAECRRMFVRPHRGRAPRFDGAAEVEARTVATVGHALAELRSLPEDVRPAATELIGLLGALSVRVDVPPAPGLVTVARPQDLRGRRVSTLYCLGLQEGVFPRPARPEPLLSDDDRLAINVAGKIGLQLHEDRAEVERLYFYAVVSRPTDELVLGWHLATDDGAPVVRSPLVDDLAVLLPDGWLVEKPHRSLGAVGWPEDEAPTEREWARFAAARAPRNPSPPIAPLADASVLGELRSRHTWSASALETWLSCPVRWFVERTLRPDGLAPEPEPLLRGGLAHRVLEQVVSELARKPGGLPGSSASERRRLVQAAIESDSGRQPISVNPQRLLSELRRLEIDLLTYLESAAATGSAFTPTHFEVGFGQAEDAFPALELAEQGELRISGRIDRIDISGADAIIYDYKGRGKPATQAHWSDENKLQVALYMIAVRRLLGCEPVGGFYQPLGAEDPRPRGALREDADPGMTVVSTDRVEAARLEELLEQAVVLAGTAVGELRAGALRPRPESCGWKKGDGCSYPTICRCVSE